MIEVLKTDGTTQVLEKVTFKEIQKLVGGFVELVTVEEGGKEVQCCCNENGIQENLPINLAATKRFHGKIYMPPQGGLGDWVILSGKDRLK